MNDNEFVYLSMIAISLIIGFILGAVSCMIITVRQNKALEEEVDKFRDLYFNELDKWRK
tara:strand:- start:2019 stop:2195 length:177 start_codon:yes stop_codon:yes gene_type:complete